MLILASNDYEIFAPRRCY